MPQMSPLLWLNLYLYFIILMFIIMLMMYNLYMYTLVKLNFEKIIKFKFKFLWY